MTAILTSFDDIKLGSLRKKMNGASRIKVNHCKGLSNVITSAKQKETSFILDQFLKIKEELIKCGIPSKLKKRIILANKG